MCCIEVGHEKTLCLISSLCYFLSFLERTAMGSDSVDEKVRPSINILFSFFLRTGSQIWRDEISAAVCVTLAFPDHVRLLELCKTRILPIRVLLQAHPINSHTLFSQFPLSKRSNSVN